MKLTYYVNKNYISMKFMYLKISVALRPSFRVT